MTENIKQKTLRLFKEKKKKEKEKEELIKQLKNKKFIDSDDEIKSEPEEAEKNDEQPINYDSPDTDDDSGTEHESDDSLLDDDEIDEMKLKNKKPPYFYIDYDEGNIQIAKDYDYNITN